MLNTLGPWIRTQFKYIWTEVLHKQSCVWVSTPEKPGIHLPVLNSSKEYLSMETSLHGPRVWCDQKQLCRFFSTILITHMRFLKTEQWRKTDLCVRVGSATDRLSFTCLFNLLLQMTLHSVYTVSPQRSAHGQIHVEWCIWPAGMYKSQYQASFSAVVLGKFCLKSLSTKARLSK